MTQWSNEYPTSDDPVIVAPLNMNGHKIIDLGTPTDDSDAVTKEYVDLRIGFDWQSPVIDYQSAPPVPAPSLGDRYIVKTTGTGLWATHDEEIAEWNGASWDFTPAANNFACLVTNLGEWYVYNPAIPEWFSVGMATKHGSLADLGNDDHTQYLLHDGSRAMSGPLDMDGSGITNTPTIENAGVGIQIPSDDLDMNGNDIINVGSVISASPLQLKTLSNGDVQVIPDGIGKVSLINSSPELEGAPSAASPWSILSPVGPSICSAISDSGQYILIGGASPKISSDYGATWTTLPSVTGGTVFEVWISNTGQYMLAVVNNTSTGYIWRSSNYGATWSSFTGGGMPGADAWWGVCGSDNGQYILASCGVGGAGSRAVMSTNGGVSWTTPLTGLTYHYKCDMSSTGQYMICAIGPSSNYPRISTNYGVTWAALGTAFAGFDVAISDDGQKILVYDSGILQLSINGGTSFTNTGIPCRACDVSRDGSVMAAGQLASQVNVSFDGGITWVPQTAIGTHDFWGIDIANGTHIVVSDFTLLQGYLYDVAAAISLGLTISTTDGKIFLDPSTTTDVKSLKLTSNMDANGKNITNASGISSKTGSTLDLSTVDTNKNINITPNGSGKAIIGGSSPTIESAGGDLTIQSSTGGTGSEHIKFGTDSNNYIDLDGVVGEIKLEMPTDMTGGASQWFRPPQMTTVQETSMVSSFVAADQGKMWFNTTTKQFMGWNGTAMVILG